MNSNKRIEHQNRFLIKFEAQLRYLNREGVTYVEVATEMRKWLVMNSYLDMVDLDCEEATVVFFKALLSSFVRAVRDLRWWIHMHNSG
jgi:hypothetical protein